MQETTNVKEGDTLVNDDGTVTISVDGIDGETAEVTDSRQYVGQDEAELENIEDSLEQGHFRVVRDSDLTTIKGVGEATAPKLEAKTGRETPAGVAEAFLHGEITADALPRADYFREWLLDNLDALDVGVETDLVRVFLFLKEHGGSRTDYYDEVPTGRAGSIKKAELSVDHISWESGAYWPDSANVAAVGADEWFHHIDIDTDPYTDVDVIERDGDHYRAVADGGVTWLSGDYVESAIEYFGVDPEDAMAHPDGEFPVVWDVDGSALFVAIAPRIQT